MWQTDTDIRAICRNFETRYSPDETFDDIHYSRQLEASPTATLTGRAGARNTDTRRSPGRLGAFLAAVCATLTRQPATRS